MTDLERINVRLDAYYVAEAAILTSQSYKTGSTMMQRADLSEIRKQIQVLKAEKMLLEADGRKCIRVVPRDL